MPWPLGESTCGRVLLRALRPLRHVCKRGAHGPSPRSGVVFTFFVSCIDTCSVRAGMLWVPRIFFFLSTASPHAYVFGYLQLAQPLLRALAFLFCSCSFWVADSWALCLLVEAPMLVCAPPDLLCSGSLCSFCLLVLDLVFSGDIAYYIRAHACSSAVFALFSSASLLHVALLVFCMNVLYLWFYTHTFLGPCSSPCGCVLNAFMLL
jgi:hypothetical protein